MKEMKQIPLLGMMGSPVLEFTDVTKLIEEYETLSSCTGTDPAAKDVITTFPYYFSETRQEMIISMKG